MSGEFNGKVQTYWRLLKYARPYKVRLIIGILSGLLIGGSLFGSFMMLPSLFSGIEPQAAASSSELDKKLEAICGAAASAKTEEDRIAAVRSILEKPAADSRVSREADKINKVFRRSYPVVSRIDDPRKDVAARLRELDLYAKPGAGRRHVSLKLRTCDRPRICEETYARILVGAIVAH